MVVPSPVSQAMPKLADRLTQLLPSDRILRKPADRAAYESDASTAFRCRAEAVVIPENTDELIALVRWCYAEGVPFVVRGSGTGLSAGATPVANGIVIVTTSLNQIRRIDPVQRIAVVEPGVINADVSRAAAAHGLFFAPDPSSQPVCTIGGNIGFNAGGAHCLKQGMTSNHVLGLKAVLATGEVVDWQSESRENVGPDWTGLFVGNEGLFGVAIEATLNLLPISDGCHTVLAGFKSATAAGEAVAAIIQSGLVPVAMELMDQLTIQAVRPVVPINYPPDAESLLLVELDGPAPLVATERITLERILHEQGTTGIVSAVDNEERARIWKVRKSAYSAYGRLAPTNHVQDIVVPRRHMATALSRIQKISEEGDLPIACICHAGDGNIHPNMLHDGADHQKVERVEELANQIIEMSIELGGSITGEHGVGLEKRHHLAHMFGPNEIDLFRRIHRVFDPRAIANPGKTLPSPECENQNGDQSESQASPDSPPEAISYDPGEFVITLAADTPVRAAIDYLKGHGHQLLFDPLFPDSLTIGETITRGLNGPNSLGQGRIRDALLGLSFIGGDGRAYEVGGRVVKNVAGFDLPKLLVGSGSQFGRLLQVTLKTAPLPESETTVEFAVTSVTQLAQLLSDLQSQCARPTAIEADGNGKRAWARFTGPAAALEEIIRGLSLELRILPSEVADELWQKIRDFDWVPANHHILKIPCSIARLPILLPLIDTHSAKSDSHIGQGGEVVYAAVASETDVLRQTLAAAGFDSQLIRGEGPFLVEYRSQAKITHDLTDLLATNRG